jgi:hypothetical protein
MYEVPFLQKKGSYIHSKIYNITIYLKNVASHQSVLASRSLLPIGVGLGGGGGFSKNLVHSSPGEKI